MNVNGTLYGVTSDGGTGATAAGTLFTSSPSGVYTLVHSFNPVPNVSGPSAPPIAVDGAVYGVTSRGGAYGFGTGYVIDASGAGSVVFSFPAAGANGGLAYLNGVWYGMTVGATGDGSVLP